MNIYGVLSEPVGNPSEDGCPAEPVVALVRAESHLQARLLAFAGTDEDPWEHAVSVHLLVKGVDGERALLTDAPEWQYLYDHPNFPRQPVRHAVTKL